jgi:hypothetical protein
MKVLRTKCAKVEAALTPRNYELLFLLYFTSLSTQVTASIARSLISGKWELTERDCGITDVMSLHSSGWNYVTIKTSARIDGVTVQT